MQTNTGKLLNFRPIILICANLILGILCTVTLCYAANLYIFLGCAFLILNLVLFVVFLIKKNKRLYITILISLIVALVVCVPFSIKIFNNLNAKSVGEILFNCDVLAVNSI